MWDAFTSGEDMPNRQGNECHRLRISSRSSSGQDTGCTTRRVGHVTCGAELHGSDHGGVHERVAFTATTLLVGEPRGG